MVMLGGKHLERCRGECHSVRVGNFEVHIEEGTKFMQRDTREQSAYLLPEYLSRRHIPKTQRVYMQPDPSFRPFGRPQTLNPWEPTKLFTRRPRKLGHTPLPPSDHSPICSASMSTIHGRGCMFPTIAGTGFGAARNVCLPGPDGIGFLTGFETGFAIALPTTLLF